LEIGLSVAIFAIIAKQNKNVTARFDRLKNVLNSCEAYSKSVVSE